MGPRVRPRLARGVFHLLRPRPHLSRTSRRRPSPLLGAARPPRAASPAVWVRSGHPAGGTTFHGPLAGLGGPPALADVTPRCPPSEHTDTSHTHAHAYTGTPTRVLLPRSSGAVARRSAVHLRSCGTQPPCPLRRPSGPRERPPASSSTPAPLGRVRTSRSVPCAGHAHGDLRVAGEPPPGGGHPGLQGLRGHDGRPPRVPGRLHQEHLRGHAVSARGEEGPWGRGVGRDWKGGLTRWLCCAWFGEKPAAA